MDAESNCSKCNTKLKTNNSLKCDGVCRKTFHFKCIDVVPKDIQVLQSINGGKWFCESCSQILNFLCDVKNEIEDFKSSIIAEFNKLKLKLDVGMGYEDRNTRSYAKATKGEAIVIKPKSKQESSKTQETIKENLDLKEIEVGITQIRNLKDGGVLIKCNTNEEIERMKEAAEKKLGKHYQIKRPLKKKPSIKVVDIEEQMEEEELVQCIKGQNMHLMHDKGELRVITIKKMKTRYMAIIECDPVTYQNIMDEGRLNIGWSPSCRVFDYVRIYRCYKCAGFNHRSDDCRRSICLKCGADSHNESECQERIKKCVNCMDANEKMKTGFDVNHSVFDRCCSVLQKRINIEKQKICESTT